MIKKVQALDSPLIAAAESQHLRLIPDPDKASHFFLQADREGLHLEWAATRDTITTAGHHWLTDVALTTVVEEINCRGVLS